MNTKKLVVIFPGVNYSNDCPLLYYAGSKFEAQGYEKVAISYGNLVSLDKSLNECIENAKKFVIDKFRNIDLSQYGDIVFVSKSMGTVVAGWLEEKLNIKVRHIFLTPLKETLQYINRGKNIIIVVAGTSDKHLDAEVIEQHCKKEDIQLKQIEGAGHRLEIQGNVEKSIEILKEIVALY
ncbi:MAG: hypothetical protein PHX70_05305 [Clostridium sp.]|nr:hypothetical protein [Clostridium sp.]